MDNAFLISTYSHSKEKAACIESLEELETLIKTFGAVTCHKEAVMIKKYDSATYLGSGKVEELALLAKEKGATLLVIDHEISPAQQRNLEKVFGMPILDRTEVILEIFHKHAQTKEAQVQIELAKIRYEMPRLKRLWTHLSRQRGGGVNQKGEGEKQIEIDKRLLQRKMENLLVELEEIRHQRATKRVARERSHIPIFAIIGYTNVGKSTLLNALTGAEVLVEDKLFATLDTTTRKFTLPNHQEILLIDTVGFIKKIPHTLVAAFRSTLEESLEADILLHIIDSSHPAALMQREATLSLLKELKADKKPLLTIFNKIDRAPASHLETLKAQFPDAIFISAHDHSGFDDLAAKMIDALKASRETRTFTLPQHAYHLLSEVEAHGAILERLYDENNLTVTVEAPREIVARLAHRLSLL